MNKTKKMQEIETKFGMNLEELLRQKYEVERKTPNKIGELLSVSSNSISSWLRYYNIPVRDNSESHLKGKQKPGEEQLRQWYIVESKTSYEIADLLGVANITISCWLRDYKIPIRSHSEALLRDKKKPDKESLRRWYQVERKSASDIAKLVGVKNVTILNWLRDYKIPIKSISETKLNGKKKPSKEQLRQWYEVEKKTTVDIAELVGVGDSTIGNWLRDYKIYVRSLSEAHLRDKKKPSKEKLIELYEVEGNTTYKISELFCVHQTSILRWLREYNILIKNQDSTRQLKREALERVIEKYTS